MARSNLVGVIVGCVVAATAPSYAQDVEGDADPLDFLTEPAEPAPAAEPAPVAQPEPAPVDVNETEQPAAPEIDLTEGGESETASDDTPPPAPSGPMLDEIVVVAQKRAENVQDVPLSVTALGGDTLKENNLSDLTSISEFTPNLVIFASPDRKSVV